MSAAHAPAGTTAHEATPGDTPSPKVHPPASNEERDQRKQTVLTHGSASIVDSIAEAIVIKEGEPFFLCPTDGQIDTSGRHGFGLYHHDTRYLSGYELRIAGVRPNPLAGNAVSAGRAVLELTNPPLHLAHGKAVHKDRLGIRWIHELDGEATQLRDRITIHNFDAQAIHVPLRLSFAADFQDVFAIRGLLRERPGSLDKPNWDGDRLVFRYEGRDGVVRTLALSVDPLLSRRDDTSAEGTVPVPGRGERSIEVTMEVREDVLPGARPMERRARRERGATTRAQTGDTAGTGGTWVGGNGWNVAVRTNALAFDAALGRSLDDLLMLRGELDGERYYAAGIPWFSTLFGRDALISAYQTIAFDPAIAAETLRLLARRQGTTEDSFRDEQPGKILHELRVGELARLHEIPHTPYYGSIDSTPLFLILIARLSAWTGSLDLFRELRSNVDRALAWIDRYGIRADSGFVAYDSTTQHGLVNQGWKDSGDGIVVADGSIAEPPIALVEVQGYVYAAKREIAELFERDGDSARADTLRREAAELQERFERAFWSDELGCYVLALEARGRPCSVVSSNAGQVLWTGICSAERARAVAQRLGRDDMFGGWGIRTLSRDAAAYNPIGYHLGTVWPHDNALIAEGFRRYGLDDHAERILDALVRTSEDFAQQRLPECFAGFGRSAFEVPVRYPIACHPQAWAAGAIPHLLASTLGLLPDGFHHRLQIERPRLPAFLDHLELRGLRVADGRVNLRFDRSGDATATTVGTVDGDLDVRIGES